MKLTLLINLSPYDSIFDSNVLYQKPESKLAVNREVSDSMHGCSCTHAVRAGACPLGAGPNPLEDPANPWPGLCGTGRGRDTFTSGIEGKWTSDPFRWDNEFFKLLEKFGEDYEVCTCFCIFNL